MIPTPIALLQQAVDYGLKLGFEPPDTLTVEPARLFSPDFCSHAQGAQAAPARTAPAAVLHGVLRSPRRNHFLL